MLVHRLNIYQNPYHPRNVECLKTNCPKIKLQREYNLSLVLVYPVELMYICVQKVLCVAKEKHKIKRNHLAKQRNSYYKWLAIKIDYGQTTLLAISAEAHH